MADLNGKALSAIAIGALFVWSGIKGWSVLGTVKDIVVGKAPTQTNVYPLTSPTSGSTDSGFGGAPSPGGIAATALEYQGHAYSFGGAPGKNAENPWDCSSFVNYIFGVRFHRAIPGFGPGKYNGTTHGPPTGFWGIWPGLQHIKRDEVVSGDLIVWTGHMGIALSGSQMISALNPNDKTKITPIDGNGNGPILCYGRYK